MSKSLVRTSLEVFGYEDDLKKDKRKKSKRLRTTLDLVPDQLRQISNRNKKEKLSFKRSAKISVHEVKKRIQSKIDPTEDNVKRLLLLSGKKLDPDSSEKIFKRALSKTYVPIEEKPEIEQQTAFTEEDFKKFEEEYLKS